MKKAILIGAILFIIGIATGIILSDTGNSKPDYSKLKETEVIPYNIYQVSGTWYIQYVDYQGNDYVAQVDAGATDEEIQEAVKHDLRVRKLPMEDNRGFVDSNILGQTVDYTR